MRYSREYALSSGASLLDSVHKQILVRSCETGQHEVLIYEGDFPEDISAKIATQEEAVKDIKERLGAIDQSI